MLEKHATHILIGVLVWFAKGYKDWLMKRIEERTQNVVDSLDYRFVGKNAIDMTGQEFASSETHWFFGPLVNRRVPELLLTDLRVISPNTRWQIKYIGRNRFFAKLVAKIEEA